MGTLLVPFVTLAFRLTPSAVRECGTFPNCIKSLERMVYSAAAAKVAVGLLLSSIEISLLSVKQRICEFIQSGKPPVPDSTNENDEDG